MTLPSSKLESHDELRVIKYRFLRARPFKFIDQMPHIQREWTLAISLLLMILAGHFIITWSCSMWTFLQPLIPYSNNFFGSVSFLNAILLPTCAICCIWANLSLDNMILLSRSGISFPFFLVVFAGMRKTFEWNEITDASLDMTDVRVPRLRLTMLNGTKVCLELKRFAREELMALLEHLEIFCTHLDRPLDSDAILAMYDAAMPNPEGTKQLSYTQLWTSSLADNFDFTSFLPLEPGLKLQNGRYVVDMQLGSGGFAATYLAKDKQGRKFVLKESAVPPSDSDDQHQKALEFLARESKVLMELDHEGIAKPLDYFIEGGRHYLVIEYLEGQDLRSYVRERGAIDETTVLAWAKQIAGILRHVHDRDIPIVHRDVTPENLILKPDGTIALIDFGAANEFISLATGTVVGKQAFISPEQIRGKATPQSDVYALGATLHFLLTGKDPIALSNSHPKKINDRISDEINNFVAECTLLEQSERTQSADLESRLDHVIAERLNIDAAPAEGMKIRVLEKEHSHVSAEHRG